MAIETETRSCQSTWWIISAIIGVVLAALLLILGGWGFIQAVFAGIIAAVILGFVLGRIKCADEPAKTTVATERSGTSGASTSSSAAASAAPSTAAAAASDVQTTRSSADTQPVGLMAKDVGAATAKPAAKKPAAKKPTAKKSAAKSASVKPLKAKSATATKTAKAKPAAKATAAKPAAATKPATKAKTAKPAAANAAAKPAAANATAKPAAPKAAAKAKRATVAADGKPQTLAKARANGADDLKLISGVGPKLEGTLNELGFWHFDQVAGWRKKEIEWVDSRLKFKGRIERDNWIAQAKILAKGGETEFSKKKKK